MSESAVEQNRAKMVSLVAQWREIGDKLRDYNNHRFQTGANVQVDDPRFKGVGVVAIDADVPPDRVALILESGNIWWYPLENCTRL